MSYFYGAKPDIPSYHYAKHKTGSFTPEDSNPEDGYIDLPKVEF